MNDHTPQSFNARSLTSEEIGQTFVFHSAMLQASERSNSVIVGPRGSGKTTILRMLTIPAVISLKNSLKKRFVDNIDYIAIFVASDFTWYPDFRIVGASKLSKEIDDKLTYEIFRLHVLRSIANTLGHCTDLKIKNDANFGDFFIDEQASAFEEMIKMLAESWGVKLKFGGLIGLKLAISDQIKIVQRMLAQLHYEPNLDVSKIGGEEFLQMNLFDNLSQFADIAEHFLKKRHVWALCFDETEIAPTYIKGQIWSSLRSFDSRFIVKISGAPYDDYLDFFTSEKSPKISQDFTYVDLFARDKDEVLAFSKGIFRLIARSVGLGNLHDPGDFFGPSYYDDEFNSDVEYQYFETNTNKRDRNRLRKNGFYERKFSDLMRVDPTFKKYLERVEINPHNLDINDSNKRASIRKLISVVVIREAYLSRSGTKHLKGRKAIDKLYTGAESIFSACEGNPRWLIWVIRPLLSEFALNRKNMIKASRSDQAGRLQHAITSLMALLSTIRPLGQSNSKSIVELLEVIGFEFKNNVLGKQFSPEPVLSFRIDKNCDSRLLPVIGQALNQGSMVVVPKVGQPRNYGSISGERIRLSHLLAPHFHLPMVVGRPNDLSKILKNNSNGKVSEQMILDNLFDDR